MKKIALVCMPWYEMSFPSIQCEILQEILKQHKIDTDIIHGYLLWGEYVLENYSENQDDIFLFMRNICLKYGYIGLGDWIFSEKINKNNTEEEYLDYLIDNTSFIEVLGDNIDFNILKKDILKLRTLATSFIEKLGQNLLLQGYEIVAFSTTLNQNLASLSLAKYLKEKNSSVKIIFGGSNCDGERGKQLIKSFKFIDYILSGEGEYSLPMLIKAVLEGTKDILKTVPGLTYRNEETINSNVVEVLSKMDDVPIPKYEQYFSQISSLNVGDYVNPQILLETSRGCWWGARSQCKFCGLNPERISFRSRKKCNLKAAIQEYLEDYPQCGAFVLVDNIIPENYYKYMLQEVSEIKEDFYLFYEIRSNLNNKRAEQLSKAHVLMVQPGIESLETKILKIMGKGLEGIDNIQTLKIAEKYDLLVQWNILIGFPDEKEEFYNIHAYNRFFHFSPPVSAGRIFLERYSPYYVTKQLRKTEAKGFYKYLYGIEEEKINNIAYIFEYEKTGVGEKFENELKQVAEKWLSKHEECVLYFEIVDEGLYIFDTRYDKAEYFFYAHSWKILLLEFIDEWKSFDEIKQFCQKELNENAIKGLEFIEELVDKNFCYVEDDKYISLVLPYKPEYQQIYQKVKSKEIKEKLCKI